MTPDEQARTLMESKSYDYKSWEEIIVGELGMPREVWRLLLNNITTALHAREKAVWEEAIVVVLNGWDKLRLVGKDRP